MPTWVAEGQPNGSVRMVSCMEENTIEFKCQCGNIFTVNSIDCERDLHCISGDDYCDCCGITFYHKCDKCDKQVEKFIN